MRFDFGGISQKSACRAGTLRYDVQRVVQQPDGIELLLKRTEVGVTVTVPQLEIHAMLVAELKH
jgi:hypothetical protein